MDELLDLGDDLVAFEGELLGAWLGVHRVSVAPLGTNTVVIIIALCTVLGLIAAYALPARTLR